MSFKSLSNKAVPRRLRPPNARAVKAHDASRRTRVSARECAQVSFELILITIVVIALAVNISAMVFNSFDSVKAVAIYKSALVEQLSESPNFHAIKKIDIQEDGSRLVLTAYIQPALSSAERAAIDNDPVSNDIMGQTKYRDITIIYG